jgi:hypothetical protein
MDIIKSISSDDFSFSSGFLEVNTEVVIEVSHC